MAVTVTGSPIVSLNTVAAATVNKATADTDALAEAFTITPTKGDGKCLILVHLWAAGNTAVAAVTATIPAGEFAGKQAISFTCPKQTSATAQSLSIIEVDIGKVLKADGTFVLTLTPGASDKLLTDHAAWVAWVELI